jgi:hypothetical protein
MTLDGGLGSERLGSELVLVVAQRFALRMKLGLAASATFVLGSWWAGARRMRHVPGSSPQGA